MKESKMKKCTKLVWVVALLGILAAQPGCMSLDHLMDPEAEISIYGGTAASLREMEDPETGWWGTLFRLIDFLPTVAVDTVLIIPVAPAHLMR
tara:strand:+ start:875 stop:1153 length:279 start_codon:yes stop_codon:yes gene_type:complete